MINTLINQFEQDLVELVNASPIPIACKRQVIANVFKEVDNATQKAIEEEAAAAEEENKDGIQ